MNAEQMKKDIEERINELAKKLSFEEKLKQQKADELRKYQKQKRIFKQSEKRIRVIKEIESSTEKEMQAEKLLNELRVIK